VRTPDLGNADLTKWNVRLSGETPETMSSLLITFKFLTFFCRILLFHIPTDLLCLQEFLRTVAGSTRLLKLTLLQNRHYPPATILVMPHFFAATTGSEPIKRRDPFFKFLQSAPTVPFCNNPPSFKRAVM
jgi:hypothetical protein